MVRRKKSKTGKRNEDDDEIYPAASSVNRSQVPQVYLDISKEILAKVTNAIAGNPTSTKLVLKNVRVDAKEIAGAAGVPYVRSATFVGNVTLSTQFPLATPVDESVFVWGLADWIRIHMVSISELDHTLIVYFPVVTNVSVRGKQKAHPRYVVVQGTIETSTSQ